MSSEPIFDIYCRFMLDKAGTMHGRYSKPDMRDQVLRLPHAVVVGTQKDVMKEEYRLIPDDVPLEGWVNDKVVGMAERGGPWSPEAFWLPRSIITDIKTWGPWVSLDAYFMPRGLEPAIFLINQRYSHKGQEHYLCEFRFLPLKSFEFTKPTPSNAP